MYKKVKVELYAPYVRADGLIQRVTIYEDYEYNIPVQSYEKYLNRNDRLAESERNFDMGTVTDSFEKGRADHCKGTTLLLANSFVFVCENTSYIKIHIFTFQTNIYNLNALIKYLNYSTCVYKG